MYNHNGSSVIIWVVIAGIVAAVSTVSARILIHVLRKSRTFLSADIFIVVSLMVYLPQNGLVLWQVHAGLADNIEELSDRQLNNLQKALYADDILFVLAVWLAKTSTACLLFRLSARSIYRFICGGCIFFMLFTMAISLAIVTLTCNLQAPWIRLSHDGVTCADTLYHWQAIAIADFITEAVLISIVLILVHPIQISTHLKCLVTFAFNQRIVLVIPITLRLYYLIKASNQHKPALPTIDSIICKQIEIMYAIIAATIPCLPRFVTATETYDVHYAPAQKPMQGEDYLSRTEKAMLRMRSSFANLQSLTPSFGKQPPTKENARVIRVVPVNVYELDNTGAMLKTLPPRDPPYCDSAAATVVLTESEHSRKQSSIVTDRAGSHAVDVPKNQRYTIEHDGKEPNRRNLTADEIALAL